MSAENDSVGDGENQESHAALPTTASLSNTSLPPTADSEKNITFTAYWGERKAFQVNHNVFLDLTRSILRSFTDGFANDAVYNTYFSTIFHGSNAQVGQMGAYSSLLELAAAIPMGYMADKFKRSTVIRYGCVLYMVMSGIQAAIMYWIGNGNFLANGWQSYWSLAIIMSVWGLGDGIVQGPCDALLADSTTSSQRLKYYHIQFVCSLFAEMVGPLVSMLFFLRSGNSWGIHPLQAVIYIGLGMEVLISCLMMRYDDDKALNEEEHEDNESDASSSTNLEASENVQPNDLHHQEEENQQPNPNDSLQTPLLDTNNRQPQSARGHSYHYLVPFLLRGADFVSSIGDGLMSPFFPLFFKDCGMSPVRVQVIYAMIPIFKAAFSAAPTLLAKRWGQLKVVLAFLLVSLSLFFTIPTFQKFYEKHQFILIMAYVLESSFCGSLSPVQRSLLMDSVPKSQRARWLSFGSAVSLAGTSASCVGGYIVDKWGYRVGFYLSFSFRMVSWLLYAILLFLVPRRSAEQINQEVFLLDL